MPAPKITVSMRVKGFRSSPATPGGDRQTLNTSVNIVKALSPYLALISPSKVVHLVHVDRLVISAVLVM